MFHELNAFGARFLPKTLQRQATLRMETKNALLDQRITLCGTPAETGGTLCDRVHGLKDRSANGLPRAMNGCKPIQKCATVPAAGRGPPASSRAANPAAGHGPRCVHHRRSCGPHCPESRQKGGGNGRCGPQRVLGCTQRRARRTQRGAGCTQWRQGALSLKRNPLPRSSPPSSQRASWPLPS